MIRSRVDIDRKTWLITTVQRLGANASGNLFGTESSDFDADALGIELGAIGVVRTLSDCFKRDMQGDKFMTHDVLASFEARGNLDSPGAIVGNHLVGGPEALGICRVVDPCPLRDLDKLQVGWVDLGAGPVAGGDVVDYRAPMGSWKWYASLPPFDSEGATGGDGSTDICGRGVEGADDVVRVGLGGLQRVASNISCIPRRGVTRVGSSQGTGVRVPSRVFDSVGLDLLKERVSQRQRSKRREK